MDDNADRLAAWKAKLSTHRNTIAAVAGIAALVALAAAMVTWTLRGKREPLLGGRQFRPAELAALQTAFAGEELNDWSCQDGRILIPHRRRAAYLQAVEKSQALPPGLSDRSQNTQVFSLLETRQSREWKLRNAEQAELSRLIEALDGIEEATVKYDELERHGLHRDIECRALAAVRASNGLLLTAAQVESIRQIILASFAGLQLEQITVADLNGSAWPGGAQSQPAAGPPAGDNLAYCRSLALSLERGLATWHGVQVTVDELAASSRQESPTSAPATRPAADSRRIVNVRSSAKRSRGGTAPSAVPQRRWRITVQLPLRTLSARYTDGSGAGRLLARAADEIRPAVFERLPRTVAADCQLRLDMLRPPAAVDPESAPHATASAGFAAAAALRQWWTVIGAGGAVLLAVFWRPVRQRRTTPNVQPASHWLDEQTRAELTRTIHNAPQHSAAAVQSWLAESPEVE